MGLRYLPTQLFSFVVVGLINTVWAYAMFALFVYLGFHYALATLISGVLSVLTGYQAHRHYVFSFKGKNRLPQFAFVFLIIYWINVGIQKLLLESGVLTNVYLSGALAVPVCALLSFWLNRNFIFR